ncbi:MAG: hypothetical protein GF417_01520 [Candidatus Latescibacteria bacterium]|nr:hypothetical protein [bacterium]MBD3423105.1 hypothetical protein [Candidatus Latescibacterota bacterium]
MDRFISRMLERDEHANRKLTAAALLVLFALLFTVYYNSGAVSSSMDALDHLSFIRRAAVSGNILPSDSYYMGGDGGSFDPRKGLFHSAAALLLLQSDSDPVFFWKMLPAFLSFVAVLAFIFFASQLLNSRWKVALALILFFIFFRGKGGIWFTRIGYSRNIAQVLFWLDAGLVLWRLKNGDDGKTDLLILLLACAAVAVHPVFSLMIMLVLLGLLIHSFLPGEGNLRPTIYRMAMLNIAGIALPLAIRFLASGGEYNFIHTHTQGMLEITQNLRIIDPLELKNSRGVIVLFAAGALPLYMLATVPRRKLRIVETIFIIPILLVLFPPSGTVLEHYLGYMHSRILNAAPVICYLAFVIPDLIRISFKGRSVMSSRRVPAWAGILKRLVAASVLLLFIFYPVESERLSNITEISKGEDIEEHMQAFELADSYLPGRSVILSDPVTEYYISGLTDHFVYVVPAQHEPPTDLKALERNRRVRDLLCTPISKGEDLAWLNEEGIEYLLLDNDGKEAGDFYGISNCVDMRDSKGSLIENRSLIHMADIEGYSLFKVKEDLHDRLAAGGESLQVDPVPDGAETGGIDAGSGLILMGFHIPARKLEAGTLLEGSLFWSTREDLEFGLPIICTVRFDTDYPRGSFYRDWYSKLYRRELEERTGKRYRFTFSGKVRGEYSFPDRWKKGEQIRQKFSVYLPSAMKTGWYQVRVRAWKRSYLRNRELRDYFLDSDSRQGEKVITVHINGNR